MFLRIFIALLSGFSASLLVNAVVKAISFDNANSLVWPFVAIASIAICLGLGLGRRLAKPNDVIAKKRLVSVLFLGSFAIVLTLIATFFLPFFRSVFLSQEADWIGLVVGLCFFPLLLISKSVRMIIDSRQDYASYILAAAIVGLGGGWLIVASSFAFLSPAWALTGAIVAQQLSGITVLRSMGSLDTIKQPYLYLLVGGLFWITILICVFYKGNFVTF